MGVREPRYSHFGGDFAVPRMIGSWGLLVFVFRMISFFMLRQLLRLVQVIPTQSYFFEARNHGLCVNRPR